MRLRDGPNLWFKVEVDSGNAAMVEDPAGAVEYILRQILSHRPHEMDGTRYMLTDINGNRVGRYWIEFTPALEDEGEGETNG